MLSTLKKINFLITKRQRKGFVILTLLLFVGMILEVFGLGILIPAISIILDPKIIEKEPMITSTMSFFNISSHQSFVLFFLGAVTLLYLIKSLFLIFLTHKQYRFLNYTTAYISNNLFSSYLSKSYKFHLDRNASELIKNIQVEINYLGTFLVSFITIFIEGGFIFSVIATLIYIEPIGAISIGLFYGILSFSLLQFSKLKLIQWGSLRQRLDANISKIALEGLGGVKDLLILGKTSFYIENYNTKNYARARLMSNQATVSNIPRIYLEFISIAGLVSFIILLIYKGESTSGLITTLGVFVAATFRMIPSINRIIAAIQSLKYYETSIDLIHKELKLKNNQTSALTQSKVYDFESKVEFKNVSFYYKKNKKILNGVNFEIQKGQTIGVIGESGSGKSTFVDLFIGLYEPTQGEIIIDGAPGIQINQSWRNNIGYVSQSIYLIDDSILNNIAVGVSVTDINIDRVFDILKNIKLESFVNELEHGIHTRVGERGVQLSGGQKQRIGIARALYYNPKILILDEATSALDSETETEVINYINSIKVDRTVIMIAHKLSTLESCDNILKLSKGQFLNFLK